MAIVDTRGPSDGFHMRIDGASRTRGGMWHNVRASNRLACKSYIAPSLASAFRSSRLNSPATHEVRIERCVQWSRRDPGPAHMHGVLTSTCANQLQHLPENHSPSRAQQQLATDVASRAVGLIHSLSPFLAFRLYLCN
jgi:hypothetical protein